jgi:putative transposase
MTVAAASVYPVVFFDGIFEKVRKDDKVQNICSYTVLGINSKGFKEILGFWTAETELASFWTSVCNDLKSRGVSEIFIACHDNLNGIDRAINTIFQKTQQQLCIIPKSATPQSL